MSDVLFAWWARIQLRAWNPAPHRTICLLNVFDTRGVQSQMGRIPSPDIALMANATYPLYCFIPAGKLLGNSVSLGWIASRLRYAVDTLRLPEQVQALHGVGRQAIAVADVLYPVGFHIHQVQRPGDVLAPVVARIF